MKPCTLRTPSWMLLLIFLPSFAAAVLLAQSDVAVEERIVNYLIKNVTPGKPFIVSDLYNNVFTTTEERKALDRLFNTFFKIPLFVAQYKATTNQIPTLDDIARQFRLRIPGEVQILLTIMESDPRVPKFIIRDTQSGEIIHVDIEAVKKDKRFSQAIERTMAGWSGRNAPAFALELLDGKKLSSTDLTGKNHLIYFWFSNCPPCIKLSPQLIKLQNQFGGKRFTIIAVNADRFLELDTTDAERAAYIKKQGFTMPVAHLNKQMQEDYGNVNVYPTLFLVDSGGVIRKHYIGYQSPEVIATDIQALLKGK
jgi:thiol-disulfide isomerase/thioredoxin